MADDFDPVAHNRAAWDREVESGNEWTTPVGPEVIARARGGDWSVVLIGYQPVPRDWFPADLAGVPLLGLASGGGQQGPVLAVRDHHDHRRVGTRVVLVRAGGAAPHMPGQRRGGGVPAA